VTEPLNRPSTAGPGAPDEAPATRQPAASAGVPGSTLIGVGGALLVGLIAIVARPAPSGGSPAAATPPEIGIVRKSPTAALSKPAASPTTRLEPRSEAGSEQAVTADGPAAIKVRERPDATRQPAALDAAVARAPRQAVAAPAYVTVNATPWATLSVDGRPLGNTPKRRLGLRAGKHTLELECPPLGRKHSLPLELAAGQHKHVVVDLGSDPPRVSVR